MMESGGADQGGRKSHYQVPMGIAVCAKSTDAAIKGRDALEVKWDKGVASGDGQWICGKVH